MVAVWWCCASVFGLHGGALKMRWCVRGVMVVWCRWDWGGGGGGAGEACCASGAVVVRRRGGGDDLNMVMWSCGSVVVSRCFVSMPLCAPVVKSRCTLQRWQCNVPLFGAWGLPGL